MAYANVTLIASAGQVNFAFPFPYLSQTHIFVMRDNVDEPGFTFLNASTITLDDPADEDSLIFIHRETPIDEPILDFVNGSVLGEDDLDTTVLQILYAQQEQADDLDNSIHSNAALQWDALNRRIINIGTPVADGDAVNKSFADTVLAGAQADADAAAASAAAADASAVASAASAALSVAQVGLATTQAGLANTARVAAELAETNAETAETNAETAETNAETAETNAELAETNAEAAQVAAAASASAAATSASNAATSESNAAASASAAEASENAAAEHVADLSATSTTSLLIGTGPKAFTTQAGKAFDAGTWVLAVSDADETNFMHGYVSGYVGTTLTVEVTNTGGAGTFADWTITVSGTRGASGTPGAGSSIVFAAEGSDIATRHKLNIIEGALVALTVADDAGNDRVNFTIAADDQIPAHVGAADPHTQYTLSTELTAHEGAADPHTVYQKESEKDANSGYVGRSASGGAALENLTVTDGGDNSQFQVKIVNAGGNGPGLLWSGNGAEKTLRVTSGALELINGAYTLVLLKVLDNGEIYAYNGLFPSNANATAQTDTALFGGINAPSDGDGSDGDFYFRSNGDNGTILYQRRAGTWVRVNTVDVTREGVFAGAQHWLNFIEGTNVTIDVDNNSGNDSVDVTINATGGSSGDSLIYEFW
jgi:tail fiber protein